MGCENAVNFLSSWKINIDQQDTDGLYTPLHLAAVSGNTRIVRRLLIKGANKTIKDKNNKTASDIAKDYEYTHIHEILKNKSKIFEQCDTKPKLERVYRNKAQLCYFFTLFFLTQLAVVFCVWPYVDQAWILCCQELLQIVTYVFFAFSWLTNPGYLRKPNKTKQDQERFLEILDKYEGCSICPDCEIIKPQRSRHCEYCQSCVQVFDHHCPWINNCVGARNHKFFLIFILSLWLNLVYIIIMTSLYITSNNPAFKFLPNDIYPDNKSHYFYIKTFFCICILVVCFLFIIPLSFLVYVHLNNFRLNKTTSERFGYQSRKQKSNKKESHSKSAQNKDSNILSISSSKEQSNFSQLMGDGDEDNISEKQKLTSSINLENSNCLMRNAYNCYAMCYKNQKNQDLIKYQDSFLKD